MSWVDTELHLQLVLVATDCHIKLYNKKFVYTFEIIQTAFVILCTTMQTQNTYTHPLPWGRIETWQTYKTSATEFSSRSGSFDGEGFRHDRPVGPLATLRRIQQGSTKNSYVTSGPVRGMATRHSKAAGICQRWFYDWPCTAGWWSYFIPLYTVTVRPLRNSSGWWNRPNWSGSWWTRPIR